MRRWREDLVVLKEAEPGPHGYSPEERPLSLYLSYGLIPLDKPSGPTSHQVTRWVRRITGFPGRIGHCGTLEAEGRSRGDWSPPDTAGEGD